MEREVIINLCGQISDGLKELDQKPHEFFFPGELDLIKSRSPQIQNAAKCEMYQAAAAMLLSAETEIQLLKIRTEKAFQEWLEMFTDYKKLLERLSEHLTLYSRVPLETPAGSFYLTEEELNFWSKELYGQIAESISRMKRTVEQMEKDKPELYLKKEEAWKGYEFRKALRNMDELEHSVAAVMEGIGAERFYSDERYISAQKVKFMMEEQGYTCLQARFLQPEGEENLMDSYEIVFSLNPYDQLWVRFVPERKHGVAVRNRCLLWMEVQTFPEEKMIRGMLEVNRERMKSLFRFPIETEGADFDRHDFTEARLKQQADLNQYKQFRRKSRKKGDLRV
ncbi:MAG: hypothetical protein E7246_06080 [Lachnoclostridium sp.]|nr:hypothetical protein [Lachnoclostridium sp.]